MSDLLIVIGLACLVNAGFQTSPVLGWAVLGVALLLLALAFADVKIRLPKVRLPWRS